MFACHLVGSDFMAYSGVNPRSKEGRVAKQVWRRIRAGAHKLAEAAPGSDRSASFFYGFLDAIGAKLFDDALSRRVYSRLTDLSLATL